MSHNSINESAFISKQGVSYRPTIFDGVYHGGIFSLPVGKTMAWSRGTTDDAPIVHTPVGWALLNGPNTLTAPQYWSFWFDRISVPAGEWLVEIKMGLDNVTAWDGRVALYSSSDVRLSPFVSFRDANRSVLIIAKVTGGTAVEVRCANQTINAVTTRLARAVISISFTAI